MMHLLVLDTLEPIVVRRIHELSFFQFANDPTYTEPPGEREGDQ